MPTERRLAAIMFTDIVGYTALMAESEAKGLAVRGRHRALLGPVAEQYHGEIVTGMKVTVKKSTPLDRLVENRIKHVERLLFTRASATR